MWILDSEDVRRALPMSEAVDAMKRAFAALTEGRALAPPRATLDVSPHDGTTLVMPAFVDDPEEAALTVKVVSVFNRNRALHVPLIHAVVIVLEAHTGRVLALLEGGALTAIRTGAASGAATDLLARPDSRSVAILGSGVQARTQLEAVCTVRPIEAVRVFSPDASKRAAFAAGVAGQGPIPRDVRAVASPEQALAGADIVCAATTSAVPVFDDADLAPGVHINAVGSFQPDVVEIPAPTVARALVVVDNREAALDEAGDLIRPLEEGLIGRDHIHADLGEVVLGRRGGRSSDEQVTLFKSVGNAVQDAFASRVVLENAARRNLGRRLPW